MTADGRPIWRSVLFVPANRPELAVKAARVQPGAVVVDLEDAIPPDAKRAARETAADVVSELVGLGVPVCVRVNAPGTPWFRDDAASLPDGLAAVVVPKLGTVQEVEAVAAAVDGRSLVAGLETALGVADARLVLRPPVVACYFGAEDYVADLGGVRTPSNAEVAVARASIALAARLAGVTALDMVTLDIGDADRFRAEALEARALSYAGKLCIHPAQVALAEGAFRPRPAEVERARRLLDAFAAAGGSTIAFEGEMVDEVVAVRARAVLAAAGADPGGPG